MKKTIVLGASPDKSRYSYLACNMLANAGIEFVPVGLKKGTIAGQAILNIREKPMVSKVHTITLYIGPGNQKEWYDYIFDLQPQRIIFNPGTENLELIDRVTMQGIEVEIACSLVLIQTGQY